MRYMHCQTAAVLIVLTAVTLIRTPVMQGSPESSAEHPAAAAATNTAVQNLPDLDSTAQSYYDLGNIAKARELWQVGLQGAEQLFGSNSLATTPFLGGLARCCESGRRWDNAAFLLKRALVIKEASLGRDHVEVAFALRNLGGVYQLQGDYERAAAVYTRSIAILEKARGAEHLDLALGLACLADAYQARGDYRKALAASERALAIRERELGENHPDVAASLDSLASICRAKGDYEQASALYRRSLSIREEWFGMDHPDVAHALCSVAALQEEQGNHDAALPLYERSLAVFEKKFGPVHAQVAYVLGCLASVQLNLGDYDRAVALSQQSLSINERLFGPDCHEVASALAGLAGIHLIVGDYAEALGLLRRAHAISEKHFGIEDPIITVIESSLASAYFYLGQGPRAIALLERGHEIRAKLLKPEHPQFLRSTDNLASFYFRCGQSEKAAELFRTSLEIKEEIYGKEHIEVAYSVWGLAHCYHALGRSEEATGLFQRCVTMKEKALGNQSVAVGLALADLAACYEFQGRNREALPLRERSLAVLEQSYGPEHPNVAFALVGLASVCKTIGSHERALALAQRGFSLAEKSYGPENPKLVTFLYCLAGAHLARWNFDAALELCWRALRIDLNAFGNAHSSVVTDFNQLALASLEQGDLELSRQYLSSTLESLRRYYVGLFLEQPSDNALACLSQAFFLQEMYHSLCGGGGKSPAMAVKSGGAERLALDKALLEELQTAQVAAELDSRTRTQEFCEQYRVVKAHMARLPELRLDTAERERKRRQLEVELSEAESRLAGRVALLAQTIRERKLSLLDIAGGLPVQSALIDLVEFHRYDCTTKTNEPKEVRYAAYLTVPLIGNSTNVVVERVDLGEATPIDEVVQFICKRMSSSMGYARDDVSAALQRLGDLVYGPLARHLTNVSHLIVCQDGQLSRVPFEMLRVGNKFLIEEKTISYVTSGREVARLARSPESKVQSLKSLVMGGPDFDLDLAKAGSSRPGEAEDEIRSPKSEVRNTQLLLTSAATRTLSRDYRGRQFAPLPGAEEEARSVAALLRGGCVLRLGAQAREADLKAVQSPRVLHLATHGFFLSDQEFRRTNSLAIGLAGEWGQAGRLPYVRSDWENPLVRCGIALAGANHAGQITNAVAEDGVLTGLEAALLNLQGTELVILSACDSGTGDVKIGEGVMSLRRAFRIAGAQTVLASHWKVSDKATRQLMTEFIRRWRAGEPRAKAWREAQLSLLCSKDFASPYFWAAFTLTGQWR